MEALYNTSVLKLILHIPYINLLQFVFERKYKICIFMITMHKGLQKVLF
jgi:hypothetical protein